MWGALTPRRPQAKVAGTAGQTGSLNTFMNGKLSTKPLKARCV